MAKLHARHRVEFLRYSIAREVSGDTLICWERITKAYMSDGKVLEKRDVRFKPDSFDPEGRKHNWGWSIRGKLKPTYDLTGLVAKLRADPRFGTDILIEVCDESLLIKS